ncbi:DUF2157 domain-containing protein [Betaproteobacteria bacterium SCN2]|jgi:hypothetical protein|nr:DUF2157 domain-containing protein [Betaproteobacteria bacterium SCN2]
MSLLLVLFYFIGIPALVVAVAVWLWRKTDSSLARGLVILGTMVTLAGLLWLAQGEKWLADQQVRELCAKDGGVRVYETVTLPPERFDKYGLIRVPAKEFAKLEDEYFYVWQVKKYRNKSPVVRRDHFLVCRRADGKLLGEAISYARIGGDMPGPWHESSFRCPKESGNSLLQEQIFKKVEE